MTEEDRRKIYCESSLQQLRAATVEKKKEKNLLFVNWSIFSRRNVLVWQDEALAGLLLMNTSALKKTDFKRSAVQKSYWDGQRMEKFCKTNI